MNQDKKFELNNVFPFHSAFSILIVIPCLIIWAALYYIFFGPDFRLGFMMIFTTLCIGTCVVILKKMSKKVTIWFNDDYLFIQKDHYKADRYLKDDILGFYCYDYETKNSVLIKSLIRFKFCLKDGKKIYLNDSEYRSKYNEKKGEDLKEILKILQSELGFTKISQNSMLNIYWYSKS